MIQISKNRKLSLENAARIVLLFIELWTNMPYLIFKGRIDRRERKWNSSKGFCSVSLSLCEKDFLICLSHSQWDHKAFFPMWKWYIHSIFLDWLFARCDWNSSVSNNLSFLVKLDTSVFFIIKFWCSYQHMVSAFLRVNQHIATMLL